MHEALRQAIAAGTGVSVLPLARALGTSTNVIYRAVERSEIKATRIGRRVIIPAAEAAKLLGLPQQEAA